MIASETSVIGRPGIVKRARPSSARAVSIPAVEGGVHRLTRDGDAKPIVHLVTSSARVQFTNTPA